MTDVARQLSRNVLFRDMAREHVETLGTCCTPVKFESGDYLYREGAIADRFFVLRHGRVSVEIFVPERGPVVVETLGRGDVLGWSWLVPPYRCQVDARALELTRALGVDGALLRERCEEQPRLGFDLTRRIARVMAERMRATRVQLLDVHGPSS